MTDRKWIALLCDRLKEQEGPEKARQIIGMIRTPALQAEMEKLIEAVELGRYNKLTRKWLGGGLNVNHSGHSDVTVSRTRSGAL